MIAAVSPIPLFIFTILWCWIWFFGVALRFYEPSEVPLWLDIISMLPLGISPTLGVIGIIHGIINRKEKRAWQGIVLSLICLMENFLLLYAMFYIGSRY